MNVLILEDSEVQARLIEDCLKPEQIEIRSVRTAADCYAAVEEKVPDIIICDILLPGGGNGLEVCRDLKRSHPHLQFMVLSCLDSTFDKIQGLETGAEDYITKPFDPVELRARFRVLRRRAEYLSSPNKPGSFHIRGLELVPATREVFLNQLPVELRRREFDILHYLMRHAGEVISRDTLLNEVWHSHEISERSIDPHIQRLRDKLGDSGDDPQYIETIRGVGYRFRSH